MTSRQSTKRNMRAAQIGAILLAAGACAVFTLPIANALSPEPAVFVEPTPANANNLGNATETGGLDLAAAAQTLEGMNPRERVEAPVSTTPNGDVVIETTLSPEEGGEAGDHPDASAPIEWAYLGSVVSPTKTYALMRMAGTGEQMLMAKGSTRHEYTLQDVFPDHVILADTNGAEFRVDLLPPTQSWPEYGPGRMPPTAAGAVANGAARPPTLVKKVTIPVNAATAAKTPPARGGAQPAANQGAAVVSQEYGATGVPLPNPHTFNYDDLGIVMTKVLTKDYDPRWVDEMLQSWGLPADASFDQRLEFFEKLNLTMDQNGEFIKAIEEIVTRPDKDSNPQSNLTEEQKKEIDEAIQRDSLDAEAKEKEERELMLKLQTSEQSQKKGEPKK